MLFAAIFPSIIIAVKSIIIAGQIAIYGKSMFSAEKFGISGRSLNIDGNLWDVNACSFAFATENIAVPLCPFFP